MISRENEGASEPLRIRIMTSISDRIEKESDARLNYNTLERASIDNVVKNIVAQVHALVKENILLRTRIP